MPWNWLGMHTFGAKEDDCSVVQSCILEGCVFFLASHVGMLFMEYVGKGYFLEQLTLVRYAYFVWYGEFVSSCLDVVLKGSCMSRSDVV